MKDLQEVRSENPGYKDLSDKQILDRMYDDHYSSMPRDEFNSKVNYDKASDIAPGAAPAEERSEPGLIGFAKGAIESAKEFGKSAVTGVAKTMADYARGEQIQSEQMASAFVPADQVNAGPKVPTGHELVKAFNLHDPKGFWGEAGQLTGEMAINPATYFGPGSAITKFLSTAGAVLGGAGGQQIGGTPGKLAGVVGGAFAPNVLLASMSPAFVNEARSAANELLATEGITGTTAGQQTGSKAIGYWESIFADAPLAGGKLTEAMEKQGRQFTRAVLRRVGVDADTATPEVIDGAFKDIGASMDRLAASTAVDLSRGNFAQKMFDAFDQYNEVVQEGSRRAVAAKIVDDLSSRLAQSQFLTGEQAQAFRSRYLSMQRSAFKDPEFSEFLSGMIDALDGSIGASLPQSALAEWNVLRRQYRNLITVDKAAGRPGEQAAEGIITPARLRTALTGTARDRRSYNRGRGDFSALSHAANIVMTPLPNSGTSQREMARSFATSLQHGAGYMAASVSGGAGAAVGAHMGPEGAVAGAMIGGLVPGVVGRATMSKPAQSYMAGKLPGQAGAMEARRGLPPKSSSLVRALAPTLPQMLEEPEEEGAEP